jgi:hypothetical protein
MKFDRKKKRNEGNEIVIFLFFAKARLLLTNKYRCVKIKSPKYFEEIFYENCKE